MRINDLIEVLEGTRDEYGNVEVLISDVDNPAASSVIKNVIVDDMDADDTGATGIAFINTQAD